MAGGRVVPIWWASRPQSPLLTYVSARDSVPVPPASFVVVLITQLSFLRWEVSPFPRLALTTSTVSLLSSLLDIDGL